MCLPGLLRSSQRIPLPLSLFQQLPSPGTFSTSRPFAERCSPPSPAEFDFLNVTDYAPAPIGSVYKFLPTGPDAPPSAQPRAAAHGAPPAGRVALDALPAGSTTPDAPQASPVDSSSTALPRAALAFSVRPRVACGPPPGFLELPPRASAPPSPPAVSAAAVAAASAAAARPAPSSLAAVEHPARLFQQVYSRRARSTSPARRSCCSASQQPAPHGDTWKEWLPGACSVQHRTTVSRAQDLP